MVFKLGLCFAYYVAETKGETYMNHYLFKFKTPLLLCTALLLGWSTIALADEAEKNSQQANCTSCGSNPEALKGQLEKVDSAVIKNLGLPLVQDTLKNLSEKIEDAKTLSELQGLLKKIESVESTIDSSSFNDADTAELKDHMEALYQSLIEKNQVLAVTAKSNSQLSKFADFQEEALNQARLSSAVTDDFKSEVKALYKDYRKDGIGRVQFLAQLSPSHPEVTSYLQNIMNPYNSNGGLAVLAREAQVKCSATIRFDYQACQTARFKYDSTVAMVKDISQSSQVSEQQKQMATKLGYSGTFIKQPAQWSLTNTPSVPQSSPTEAEKIVNSWFSPATTSAATNSKPQNGTQVGTPTSSIDVANPLSNVSYLYIAPQS